MSQNNYTTIDRNKLLLDRQINSYSHNNNYTGELTGEKINDSTEIFDKGMPFRSTFTLMRKQQNNSHNDFDLFGRIDKTDKHVTYIDSQTSDFADINDTMISITSNANPYETCINDISSTACWLNSNMSTLSNTDYVINGLGFFILFGIIYLTSKGKTELELKNYFNFQDKKHLNASLLTITDEIINNRDQIIFDNYFIHNKTIPYNKKSFDNLNQLVTNIAIDKNNISNEIERINKIISINSKISNVVSLNTISKSNLSLISIAKIKPKWLHQTNSFNHNFLRWINKSFKYFEDTDRQIIELPLYGKSFVFGVINKKTNCSPIDYKTLSLSMKYMKSTLLDEIVIPAIKKMYKIRLNKTLLKTGLNISSFNDIIGLYPEYSRIDDCIQYIDIDLCANNVVEKSTKEYRSSKKFIINDNFEFYLKNIDINCIMLIGKI